ncbi:MAG: thioredoxin family protein [Magnetovibrio sp.]|nr:thioredoxin family protein [Magnetovibrio sp.]
MRTALIALITLIFMPFEVSAVEMRDDGLHYQPWIKTSFLDIREDIKEAVESGKKGLVVIYEQQGCGSCRRLHEINFADQKLVKYITDNFDVIQINLYSDNEVTDVDGEVMTESMFAEKHRANFTPTTAFYDASGKEVFRMPGFMSLKFYKRGFDYVVKDGPASGLSYPRWVREQRQATSAAN